ncbi:GIY-YIG nuclease family protein [Roseibium aggregatum]
MFCSEKTPAVIAGLDPAIHAASYPYMRRFWVYMLASRKNGTLYTGVTNDLARRIHEHETGQGSKFAARYGVVRLVWYEEHPTAPQAIAREKAIKSWPRKWKIDLIQQENADWFDLKRFLNS